MVATLSRMISLLAGGGLLHRIPYCHLFDCERRWLGLIAAFVSRYLTNGIVYSYVIATIRWLVIEK